jgi:hypothetical protein
MAMFRLFQFVTDRFDTRLDLGGTDRLVIIFQYQTLGGICHVGSQYAFHSF